MKLRDYGLLTDENMDPEVTAFLRGSGFNVLDVCEQGLQGTADVTLLRLAVAENRVIVTHDSDFGTLVILQGEPVTGILFLRPGHIDPQFTIDSLRALFAADPDVAPPFILVVKRSGVDIAIRVRQLHEP